MLDVLVLRKEGILWDLVLLGFDWGKVRVLAWIGILGFGDVGLESGA